MAQSLEAYAVNIHDLTPILQVVERIIHKHASLHILPWMYHVVAQYLIEAIGIVLAEHGIAFVDPLKAAWIDGYWALAYIFIDGEAKLYKNAGWEGWKEFVVAERAPETQDITSFVLKPTDGTPLRPSKGSSHQHYQPGQYISVQLIVDEFGFKQSRQ